MAERIHQTIDALLPGEMAIYAEETGVKKATLEFGKLFVLAGLAGAFIAFGAMLATVVTTVGNGELPFGVSRLLGGFVFSLGLVLVVVGGAELFTGNNLIVMSWANRKVSTTQLLRNWSIVFLGNLFGAGSIALLAFFSGHLSSAGGRIGENALSIANYKSSLSFREAVLLGVLCNILVCLAVWLSYSARTTADKILAVVPPVTAFVACGFEHSVANMYFIPVGLLVKTGGTEAFWSQIGRDAAEFSALTWEGFLLNNLVPVTIGNIIGGAVLVGAVYWWVYLRKRV